MACRRNRRRSAWHDGKPLWQRKLEERILDLRGMFRGVDAVVARDRRDKRETVEPVAVDPDFAKRRRDGVRLRRDKSVLDPRAVARRKDDDAAELRAAYGANRPPRRLARIRPSSVRQDENVRPFRRQAPSRGTTSRQSCSQVPFSILLYVRHSSDGTSVVTSQEESQARRA